MSGRYSALSGAWTKDLGKFVHIASHEFGHNIGLMHAGVVACAGVVPTDACLSDDVDNYGDPYDTMGNRFPVAQFSSVHKQKLNTLAPSDRDRAARHRESTGCTRGTRPARPARGCWSSRGRDRTALQLGGPEREHAVRRRLRELGGERRVDPIVGCRRDGCHEQRRHGADRHGTVDAERLGPPLMPGRTYADPANGVRISVDFVANPWAMVTVTVSAHTLM